MAGYFEVDGQWRVLVDRSTGTAEQLERSLRRIRGLLPTGSTIAVVDLGNEVLDGRSIAAPYVLLVDPRVELLSVAFSNLSAAVTLDPGVELLFGEESHGPARERRDIGGWCPERLRTGDYLPGVIAVSSALLRRIGPHRPRTPMHRWDLVLRWGEAAAGIEHLGATLSHRPEDATSDTHVPGSAAAGLCILQDHCDRIGLAALASVSSAGDGFRARRVAAARASVTVVHPMPPTDDAAVTESVARFPGLARRLVVRDETETTGDAASPCRTVYAPGRASLAERVRWAVAAADTELVCFVPPSMWCSDPSWLDQLVGLVGRGAVASGPSWHGAARPVVARHGEISDLPLAGTVMPRSLAAAIFDRGRLEPVGWFDPVIGDGAFGGRTIATPDVAMVVGGRRATVAIDSTARRPHPLFPLPR